MPKPVLWRVKLNCAKECVVPQFELNCAEVTPVVRSVTGSPSQAAEEGKPNGFNLQKSLLQG